MNISYQLIGFLRAYPLITNISMLLAFLLTNNYDNLLLFIFLLCSDIFNFVLKHWVIEPIMGNKTYPIVGNGKRPYKAKSCNLFIDPNEKVANSYGMPSGHSQNAVIFTTLIINAILKHDMNIYAKILACACLVLIALMVILSRVILHCHTIQQVIAGGLLGFGIVVWFLKNQGTIKEKLSKDKFNNQRTNLTIKCKNLN